MIFLILFAYLFFSNSFASKKNQFIFDYFNYKKVPGLVGFTCSTVQDDLILINDLSKLGVTTTLHKLLNHSSIKKLAYTKYRKIGVFLDIGCFEKEKIELLFSEASNNWMFDDLYSWLILSSDIQNALLVIDDRSFGISTDFVISAYAETNSYKLYDIYNICKERGGLMNVSVLGEWNERRKIKVLLNQEKFPRRSNLHQLNFRSIYFKLKYRPPTMPIDEYLEEYKYPIMEGLNKFCYILLKHLSELHNFSIHSHESPAPQQNDSFGAHTRILAKNLVDFSGSPALITGARASFMKFAHMAWPFRSCFIFRNPQPKNIKVEEVLIPLAQDVWNLTFVVMVISMVVLVILLNFEQRTGNTSVYSDSFLITVGSLSQQGTIENIMRVSTRIAVLFIMIFSYLIFNYYSSSFVYTRLNGQIFKINDSLLQMGKLNLVMASEWMAFLKLLLSYPDWETRNFHENYWLKIPEGKWYLEPVVGMRLVQKGGLAYHTLPDTAYPIIETTFNNNEICELMEVHLSRPKLNFFAVRYNSTLTEIARVGLTKISEVGLRHRNLKRWKRRKPICRNDILSASSINIFEFSSHLIILAIGMILAFILWIFEILISWRGRRIFF